MKRKLVFGVGMNDADYLVIRKGIWCPFYRTWINMLKRCYWAGWQNKYPTYLGCRVCGEWLIFSNFKTWMEVQDWQGNQLDKDILGKGKLYSPDTCCFVPQWLNTIMGIKTNQNLPTGVSKEYGKYSAKLRTQEGRKRLGVFDTPEIAANVYAKAKLEYVEKRTKCLPDPKIREAILSKLISALKAT